MFSIMKVGMIFSQNTIFAKCDRNKNYFKMQVKYYFVKNFILQQPLIYTKYRDIDIHYKIFLS